METLNTTLTNVAHQAYDKLVDLLPEAALAILIVGVGILIAVALHYVTMQVLDFFAVDKLAAKTPVGRMLKNVGINKTISEILAMLVFWLCILLTLVIATRILHLPHIANAIDSIVRFIPRVMAIMLIVVFGMLLAKFLEVLVSQPLLKTGFKHANSVGRAVYMITVIFVLLIAFDQLGMNDSSVTSHVLLVLSVVLFIVGIGVIIAARSVLENALACQQIKQLAQVGQSVKIDGQSGTIRSFTFTSVLLDADGDTLVIPAQHFLNHTYRITSSRDDG